ncbi:hybrid sensor histidine kinase/response regulator [Cerasicoccus frondis]|uniref:hybrid sensor histidine kinase/response regulator n=1 Tax=Cerasicoccus frondis TaxID=490090 RepID=UPI0028529CDD|nr:hybrid sensor histidine kinase/response regulator [Cerasicoccus frondis]
MSDVPNSFPMLDLYQQEVETQGAALNEGLVAWESDPASADIDGLMRAAHSLKGAARIVGLDMVGKVAHNLEDLMVAAGKGEVTLGSDQLDWLFNAVDILVESGKQAEDKLGAWLKDNAAWADEVCKGLAKIQADGGVAEASKAEPAPEPVAEPAQPAAPPKDAPKPAQTIKPPKQTPDLSMIDLYRMEAEQQIGALKEGLDHFDPATADADAMEPLMRAAHSMKGAARIVGLMAAVEMSKLIEDAFNAAIKGDIQLAPEHVENFSRAAHYLGEFSLAGDADLAEWPEKHAEDYSAIMDDLQRTLAGETLLSATPPEPAPAPPAPEPVVKGPASAQPTPSKPNRRERAKPDAAATPEKKNDSVVRVSADSLNRLMGLAAETVVETGQLETFRDTLLRLKEAQGELSSRIDASERILDRLELAPESRVHFEQIRQSAERSLTLVREQLEHFDAFARRNTLLSDRLYREVLASRMRPFNDGVQGFPRMVRDVARTLGKTVRFEIEGKETPVDRDILERLEAPLNHILRNACDHGMEMPDERTAAGKDPAGSLTLSARHSAGMLVVEVKDDGRGIDCEKLRGKVVEKQFATQEMVSQMSEEEVLEFLFLPGFSTAGKVTEISGRGVGLDVVQTLMQQIGGQARIKTAVGVGTTFHLQVPITRSVIRALLAEIDGEPYAFPLSRIARTLRMDYGQLKMVENRQYFEMEGQNVGLAPARSALGFTGAINTTTPDLDIVVVNDRNQLYGIEVDRLIGEADLVVRPLDKRLGKVPGVSSASLTESGEPILILDVEDLIASIDKLLSGGARLESKRGEVFAEKTNCKRILVVDDSITVRETERQLLENAGYAVEVAVDGADGWNAVRLGEFDLVVSDIDMPRMNGYEFVSKIRSDNRLENLPVIVVSYKDREEDRIKGLEAGADYYLTKSSFQDDTFIQAVRDLID